MTASPEREYPISPRISTNLSRSHLPTYAYAAVWLCCHTRVVRNMLCTRSGKPRVVVLKAFEQWGKQWHPRPNVSIQLHPRYRPASDALSLAGSIWEKYDILLTYEFVNKLLSICQQIISTTTKQHWANMYADLLTYWWHIVNNIRQIQNWSRGDAHFFIFVFWRFCCRMHDVWSTKMVQNLLTTKKVDRSTPENYFFKSQGMLTICHLFVNIYWLLK